MEVIWDLLKEFDFLLTNTIKIEFVCILCKKILIDARIGPCQCRFCKICIENYLKNGENICPGSTDECKDEYLNLIENINIDHSINRKIGKLKIYCPIESCTFSDQIINMNQHLIGCRENAIKCSFSENGCNFISLSGENVDKHCKMSKDKHLELVLSDNINMKIINDSLNENIYKLQQDNFNLLKENDKDKDLLKQNEEFSDQMNKNKFELQEENEKLKIEKEKIINTLKQNEDSICEFKQKYENGIKDKESRLKYLSEYFNGNQIEFVWAINNLSKSIDKTIYSDEFYIYKNIIWMQLTFIQESNQETFKLSGRISNRKPSSNSCCPFICDVTMGYFNEISGNFFSSYKVEQKFQSGIICLEYKLNKSRIKDFINENSLTVKCLVKLSL